jgi:predicted NBD/HSP70 family sugar kinase
MGSTPDGPIWHGAMRERNLAILLRAIATNQPVSRAQLASLTGLAKTTVSNLVTVLADAGIVRDGQLLHEGERGRPGVAVTINSDAAAGLGLEINVKYLAACVLDLGRRVRYRHMVALDNRGRAPEAVVASLAQIFDSAKAAVAEQGLSIAGAVVAVPGVLNWAGTVRAPNLGWSEVPIASLLSDVFAPLRLPIELDNEANLAALGELWFGLGPEAGDFVHVSGETGIGSGIVVDRQVFRGAHGFAGELGHVTVEPDGLACTCGGRGCLEGVAGQEAILRAAGLDEAARDGDPRPAMAVLVERLQAGDPAALAAVERAGRALGLAVSGAAKLLDPDTVVLGGIFAPLGLWVRPVVERELQRSALHGSSPRVAVSPVAAESAVLGAAGKVIELVHADPALLLR